MRQAEALRDAGHEVLLVGRHTDQEMKTRFYGVRSAVSVATGVGPDPTAELQAFRPDVVHVHNLFPNFGERWLSRWDGPLVATVHNYRPICANALLYREGQVCTLCPDGDRWASLRHACYRESRVATMPLTIHNLGGTARNRLLKRADRIITLSARSRAAYNDSGSAAMARKTVVIPNGIVDRSAPGRPTPTHWTFVGRLTPEKGIKELVEAWPRSEPLRVVGDGPLAHQLRTLGREGVTFDGALPPGRVDGVLRESWGLVFPSRCMEGFPTVVAEAAMHGIPTLARRGSSGADFVERTGSGLAYGDESEIPKSLRAIRARNNALSVASQQAYASELSVDTWVLRLLKVYKSF